MEKNNSNQTENMDIDLNNIINSIGDGLITTDENGKITNINPVAEKLTGWKKNEVLGTSFDKVFNVIHTETGQKVFNSIKEIISKNIRITLSENAILISKNGKRYYISASISNLKDDKGNVNGIVVIFRDVTDKHEMREKLSSNEKFYHSLFEQSASGIVVHDEKGNILEVNNRFCDLFGYTKEELLKLNVFQTHPPGFDAEKKGRQAMEQFKKEGYTRFEAKFITKDGVIFDGEITSSRIYIKDKMIGQAVLRDITEKKRIEEALDKRIYALSQPFEQKEQITLQELFNIEEIQRLQDEFAQATGVASIITNIDGTPITKPSNFCRLCNDIIRKTEKGRINCYRSDSMLGKFDPKGPTIQPCMSGGLWDAGAAISVGNKHIANWLIGQVRDDTQNEDSIREYAREIGADEEAAAKAFQEVTPMSREKFGHIAKALHTFANQLSTTAYQNISQAHFIIQLKKAEKDLADQKERLANILEGTNAGTWEWNVQTGETIFNERWAQIIGYTLEEISPVSLDTWIKYTHPDDLKISNDLLQKHFDNELEYYECEARMKHKDGHWVWILDRGKIATLTEDGKPLKMFGTHQDITERKQAEIELQKSESFLLNIIESIQDGISVLDEELNIKRVNSIMEKWYEASMPLVGKKCYICYQSSSKPCEPCPTLRAFKSGNTEFNIVKGLEGSTVKWIELFSYPIKDSETGKVTGVVEFVRDISERKKAEDDLQKARNYISNIINSMPSLLIGIDPDGIVTQWNLEAERVTGLSSNEAIGQPLEKAMPYFIDEMKYVKKALTKREKQIDTRRPRFENGDRRFEDVTVYPLVENGIDGAVIRIDDVTDRVRIEEMMVQSEKMLSIGGLAAGMAHEINNPLAGILQIANVLSDRLTNKELPANQRTAKELDISFDVIFSFMEKRGILKMLEHIRKSGKRVAEIVSNMLSFARKSDTTYSFCNPAELLDKSIDLASNEYDLKKKFDFRQIKLIREYQRNIPEIPCEESKIQQVFFNILRNGAEAMQQKKEELGNYEPEFIFRINLNKDKNMINIEIEDNGPGIDDVTRKRIFEPFFTTKPIDKGTGLGLSVSYFIVTENHSGEMNVESIPGKKTNFIIRLPLTRKK